MAAKLRRKLITFVLTVTLSLACLLTQLSIRKKQRLSQHLEKFAVGSNSPVCIARSQCCTVGFVSQRRNGLGNHLFFYAGVMYVAWLTGRKPFILSSSNLNKLDKAFHLDIAHMDNNAQCPVNEFIDNVVYAYNVDIESLSNVEANVSVWLRGYFCSWKYTKPIEGQLRRNLQFRSELTKFAATFLSANVPGGWKVSTFVRVGVHVRRGDFLSDWAVRAGFTVASKQYLNRAMAYFVKRYAQVQFIVASNDIDWCCNNINASYFDQTSVNITFSVRHSTEQDLALLASCDHAIMTTGTFGWWAAWLANGTTIYYKDFPRRGSRLWQVSTAADYFPQKWIGM